MDKISQQKEKAAKEKRHWVRLTRVCNNRCIFCLDSENQNGSFVPLKEIEKDLRQGRSENIKRVILSGGEPTIHPQFLEIIKLAKSLGYSHIQVITNGRIFTYKDFLVKVVKEGVSELTFSIHGHTKTLYEKQSQVKDSFEQAIQGLLNALSISGLIVNLDIVINKINYKHLDKILRFFIKLGVREFDLLQVMPFGRAWENKEKVLYNVEEALPYLRKAFALSKNKNLFLWTNRFPVEYLEGFEDLIQHPIKIIDEVKGRELMFTQFLKEGKLMNCYGERCQYCFLKDFCKDLIEFQKKKILFSKPSPMCVKLSLPLIKLDEADIYQFANFYINHRYFVKSRGCKECYFSKVCFGAPIDYIRKERFTILKPLKRKIKRKIWVQKPSFYRKKNLIYNFHFLAMKYGLKDVCRLLYPSNKINLQTLKLYQKTSFSYLISDFEVAYESDGLLRAANSSAFRPQKFLYFCHPQSLQKMQKIVRLEKELFTNPNKQEAVKKTIEIGRFFGYPDCCVKFFSQHINLTTPELIFLAYQKSKNYSFYLNNLDNRVSLIFHIPCSYDCAKSIKYAKKLLDCLNQEKGKDSQNKIEQYLKSPFIYFKSGEFIRLSGYFQNKTTFLYQELFYSIGNTNIWPPKKDKVFNWLIKILAKGSKILIKKNTFTILDKKNERLVELKKFNPAFIFFNFQ